MYRRWYVNFQENMLLPWPTSAVDAALHLPLLALPSVAGAAGLPVLAESVRVAPPTDLSALLALLLGKRATLYACALACVGVAAKRSSASAQGLGERFEQITNEAIAPLSLPKASATEVRAVARTLDSSSQSTQAAALPVVFGFLLFLGFAVTSLSAPLTAEVAAPTSGAPWDELARVSARAVSEIVQPLSNAAVCAFCVNAEVQASARAIAGGAAMGKADAMPSSGDYEDGSSPDDSYAPPSSLLAAAVSIATVGSAFLMPPAVAWPVQNVVNACVAISVARVLQLGSLAAVCAALVGLALYDGVGTILTSVSAVPPPAGLSAVALDSLDGPWIPWIDGAADAARSLGSGVLGLPGSTILLADGATAPSSVMESVAQNRLGGASPWQPGLLVVSINGRITDALGLGDVVFPAMLAGWAHRFDLHLRAQPSAQRSGEPIPLEGAGQNESRETSMGNGDAPGYLSSALSGYAFGCLLLEVAPPELTRAALLFLAPSIIGAVGLQLLQRGDFITALSLQDPRGESGQ